MTRRLGQQEKCAGLARFRYFSEEPLGIREFMHNGESERKIDFALQIGERHRLRRSHTRIDSAIDPRFGEPPPQLRDHLWLYVNCDYVTRRSNDARQF